MNHDSARVVVIGTGPAGAAAAVFLSRAGIQPLLLEAGSETAALGLTARVRGLTLAKLRRPLHQRPDVTKVGNPAAELLEELAPGGLSNHWACAVPRFAEEDFADGARAGEAYTWPIGYAELAPWYDRVEPFLRIAGASADVPRLPAGRYSHQWALGADWGSVVAEAARDGRDVVAMPYAYGAETIATRSATAFNAFTRMVKPLVRRGAARVRYGAQALRLEWSPSERRVVAVVYRDVRTGSEQRVPCRAVVLAAGAVNSAQILLESACAEFPEGLGSSSGVLGHYLHDHPLAKVVIDLQRGISLAPASYVTRPPLERTAPLYAAACMQWNNATALGRTFLAGTPGLTKQLGFSIFGTMVPTVDDFVAVERGKASSGRLPLHFSLRYADAAIRELERTRDDLMGALERAGWEPKLSVFKVEAPGNSVHYGGTCRMHASPRFGVVDARSRVHGVPNVVVADSAVFTTGPEKNPVLTAMTLGARASTYLAEDVRAGDL